MITFQYYVQNKITFSIVVNVITIYMMWQMDHFWGVKTRLIMCLKNLQVSEKWRVTCQFYLWNFLWVTEILLSHANFRRKILFFSICMYIRAESIDTLQKRRCCWNKTRRVKKNQKNVLRVEFRRKKKIITIDHNSEFRSDCKLVLVTLVVFTGKICHFNLFLVSWEPNTTSFIKLFDISGRIFCDLVPWNGVSISSKLIRGLGEIEWFQWRFASSVASGSCLVQKTAPWTPISFSVMVKNQKLGY